MNPTRQYGEVLQRRRGRQAFTLIEILVVVSLIALLLALLMPALAGARSQARGLVCRSNLRQLVLANSGYATENDGALVPAASDMWDNAGLHRWHGARIGRNDPFDPNAGPLVGYLAEGRVKECPARITFIKGKDWNSNFEQGCGGYGYNMAYLGSRLWDSGLDSADAFQQAYARSASIHEIRTPARTLMFTDAAMANGGEDLIEYSFAEPPFAVFGGQVMTGFRMSPSIHFRHRNRAGVGWADGHVDSETMAESDTSNVYGVDASVWGLGWFDPIDNSLFDLREGNPPMTRKAVFAWSGGKDSALALREIQSEADYQIIGLMTTVTGEYDRVCMHGVRTVLIEQQARALELPLDRVYLDKDDGQEAYDAKMGAYLEHCRRQGVEVVVFGDIFLQDLRQYREDNLAKVDMEGVFPLWQRDTKELAQTFIDSGFEAVLTCVDGQVLSGEFVGRCYDRSLLADLPDAVDPCGEHGEFHSFVHDGPIFHQPIAFERGPTVLRDNRFHFIDLAPVGSEAAV